MRGGPGSGREASSAEPPTPGRKTDGPASRGPVWGREASSAEPPTPGRKTDGPASRGPVWGDASEELNATILEWPPGGGPGETVAQLDVVYAVLGGSLLLNGEELQAGEARIVAKGTPRTPVAGPDGVRYLTAHRRRPPLQIQ